MAEEQPPPPVQPSGGQSEAQARAVNGGGRRPVTLIPGLPPVTGGILVEDRSQQKPSGS